MVPSATSRSASPREALERISSRGWGVHESICSRIASRDSQPACNSGSGDLPLDQVPEHPVRLHEFVERAALYNFSGLQYVDAVGLF